MWTTARHEIVSVLCVVKTHMDFPGIDTSYHQCNIFGVYKNGGSPKLFSLDLNVSQIGKISGLNRNTINRYLSEIRT